MQGIVFDKVSKQYKNAAAPAVNQVSFTVDPGSLVVLLGPSGCGKTTLLKMVNRLFEPSEGTIYLDGVNIRDMEVTALRRQIGYVIQQVGLFPHMTVAENIALIPSLLKWEKPRIQSRVDELLTLIHLDPLEYRDRYPAQLSGGQQQRVGLARALAGDPNVLLMDEPFGAIDAITRASLQQEVMQLQNQLQKTVLFVTHDVEEALLLADKIAILKEGALVQYDTPWNLLTNPADEFVRELINADDRIRQLTVLKAKDVMIKPSHHEQVLKKVQQRTDLRQVLSLLLSSPNAVVAVTDSSGKVVGEISLQQLVLE
ncbi:MAG: ABC transporter ATP-binding protein [Anaerolineaceae bacterium]|nr:ABC transporter ATP-binding protein [Anaerolineaceae bacterium]